jgi:hypothetical protein
MDKTNNMGSLYPPVLPLLKAGFKKICAKKVVIMMDKIQMR